MAKFCTNCGAELNGAKVCPSCGTPAEESEILTSNVQQSPAVITVPAETKDPNKVSAWGFFGLMVLFTLPFIGFIATIVMALAPSNKTIKSFARGYILYAVIIILIACILFAIFAFQITNIINSDPQVADAFSNLTGENFDYEAFQSAMDEYLASNP